MIFWQFFLATVGIGVGLAVAVAAVIGFMVLAHLGKETYDERRRTVWRNEPPTNSSPRR